MHILSLNPCSTKWGGGAQLPLNITLLHPQPLLHDHHKRGARRAGGRPGGGRAAAARGARGAEGGERPGGPGGGQ